MFEEVEMNLGEGLNTAARQVFLHACQSASASRLIHRQLDCGAHLLDFGVKATAGLEAGVHMAHICVAGQAAINLTSGNDAVWPGPWVQIVTDHPLEACMLAQYAGWPVKHGNFFAMGSGPMRLRRGREELLSELSASDSAGIAVGTLECDELPDDAIAESIAAECQVAPQELYLAVAPTRSTAGCLQVVARSVETCLHKLHDCGFDLASVRSAHGIAPLPPPTPDFAAGIGRTNDAILYGARVTLWMDADDDGLAAVGAKLPSSASRDFGQPFCEIFKRCDYDFYKIDPGLFSPAEVNIFNMRTGRSWRFGGMRADLVAQSFETISGSVV